MKMKTNLSIEPYTSSELAKFTRELALAGHLLAPEDQVNAMRMLATVSSLQKEVERLVSKCVLLEGDLARAKAVLRG